MADKKSTIRPEFTTGQFRVSFPNIFKARAAKPGDEPYYSVQALFPDRASIKQLEAEAMAAAADRWGDQSKWPKNIQWPFRKGEDKAQWGYPAGSIFVNAKSKRAPGVTGPDKKDILESDLYGGCYARAILVAMAWDYLGRSGVSFGLRAIQKWTDGEPFVGGGSADDFDAIPVDNGAGAGQDQAKQAAPAGGGINLGI